MRRRRSIVAGIALALVLAACGTAGVTAPFSASAVQFSLPEPPTVPVAAPAFGWTPISTASNGVAAEHRVSRFPDGNVIQVVRFRAQTTTVHLHIGATDPATNLSLLPPGAGSAVSAAERPLYIAAFNGGFKEPAAEGGVLVDGHVVVPLTSGAASFVIYADGSIGIGAWGHGVPDPTKKVVSVRQNLQMLLTNGVIAANAGTWTDWGLTLHGVAAPARSAVGVDPSGNLYFAGSMQALPIDLAVALKAAGATQAMQMDINPFWIQLDVAPHPGATPVASVPGQLHWAGQYLEGWSRDFFVVVSRGGIACTAQVTDGSALNALRQRCHALT